MQQSSAQGRQGVAVVTGASAGVGRAIAVALAEAGYDVALIARNAERLRDAEREVTASGARAVSIVADVADAAAIDRAGDEVMRAFGRIDLWINSAMATVVSPVHLMQAEEFRRVTEVTYLGMVHGTLTALRYMRPRDRGVIVQVGSALAYRSIPLQSAYCAAKFAGRGFTDSLRSELHHIRSRIKLTMVHLPAVNTPQFDWARSRMPRRLQPVAPIYQPEEIAAAVLHAVRATPREYWIGWPTIRTILANMVAPGLLDRLAARAAWDGQMTHEPADPHRVDNLFASPSSRVGAHGRFDDQAGGRALSVESGTARAVVFGAGLCMVAASIALAARRKQRGSRSPGATLLNSRDR